MGYTDDLIARLRDAGAWEQLTVDQQQRFQDLSGDQARQILVMDDLWEMGERPAIEVFGLISLTQMIGAFQGALVERAGEKAGRLSEAGGLLAEFFLAIRQRGVSLEEMSEELQKLSPLVIAALIAAYKGPAESG